jgi:hypothetical protein
MHEHFAWNSEPYSSRGLNFGPRLKSEYEIINVEELDVAAREIRNFAEHKAERVPDKKEARAMARLAKFGRSVVRKSLDLPATDIAN